MSVKLLLDTDIGSDIDDAACLAYLLAQPECALLGITTVSGEAEKRAMIASALCRLGGQDVPIFPGTEMPLTGKQKQPQAPQAKALSDFDHDTSFPKGEAVEFLRRTVHDNPGEVTLLAIGPMTNVALLFSLDPEIKDLLRGLVLMCGVFTPSARETEPREWNALLDPIAASIVYRTPVSLHRSIGLDVTSQVVMPSEEVRKTFTSKLLRGVLQFADIWFEERDCLTFHDPLAAASIFLDSMCRFEWGNVEVRLAPEGESGVTEWSPSPGGHCEVAVAVDPGAFFDHYLGTLSSQSDLALHQ